MDPHKPGNSQWRGPEVVDRKGVARKQAAQAFRRRKVKNEMRSVLGWMTTGAA